MRGLTVVVTDDEALFREGLVLILERAGLVVVGQGADSTALLDLVDKYDPDVAITDVRMPPSNMAGLLAAQELRQKHPGTGVLVLSAHVEVEHATELLSAGTSLGYLLKQHVSDAETFIAAVRRVAAGEIVVDPTVVHQLMGAKRRNDPLLSLSERERVVLELLAQGLSNAGIASKLWLAEGTVEKHVRSILQKLELGETRASHRRVLAVLHYLDHA